MKLHPDAISAPFIAAYGPGWVQVQNHNQGQSIQRSMALSSTGTFFDWPVTCFEDLAAEHFEMLLAPGPELVILGSGPRLRFVAPELTQALIRSGIGLEVMDTQAACRTYNILAAEGRRVLVALILA